MSENSLPLPEFSSPPVVEVAISLQFEPIEALHSAHLGLLWDVFRSKGFSLSEDHAELQSTSEDFEREPHPRIGVRWQAYDDAPPLPRIWFLNVARNELIQVQRNRFVVNWRQGAESHPYPRYVHIRRRLEAEFREFTGFLEAEKLGVLQISQCELTYVNHILSHDPQASLSSVITTWAERYSEPYLPQPEDVAFHARYKMADKDGQPLGRLHVDLQPGYKIGSGESILVLNMTARGAPKPADLVGALALFDDQHEWIVRGFASITTKTMHKIWGRKYGS